jgi:probable phosphoglycerate mutase
VVIRTTVVLARHGRTGWHSPNRYTGSSDIPLDPYGVTQADALARWAAGQGFTSLTSSPLRRARATLAPTATLTGLPARVDDRLRELDFGVAEGRTLDELRELDPGLVERFVADPVANHFPAGEPPAEAVTRALAGLADAVAADPGGRLLVVAHNTLIRLVTCAVLGLPLAGYRRRLPELDPAATTTLRFSAAGESVALIAYNVPVPRAWEHQPVTDTVNEPRTR